MQSTPSEYQRVFAEIAREQSDGILVGDIGDLISHRQLIVEAGGELSEYVKLTVR